MKSLLAVGFFLVSIGAVPGAAHADDKTWDATFFDCAQRHLTSQACGTLANEAEVHVSKSCFEKCQAKYKNQSQEQRGKICSTLCP